MYAIIGIIECYYSYIEKNIGIVIAIISTIIHLSLLFVLVDFQKYGKMNLFSLVLLFIVNLVILFLPYWPYSIKRESLLLLYNFEKSHSTLALAHLLLKVFATAALRIVIQMVLSCRCCQALIT